MLDVFQKRNAPELDVVKGLPSAFTRIATPTSQIYRKFVNGKLENPQNIGDFAGRAYGVITDSSV